MVSEITDRYHGHLVIFLLASKNEEYKIRSRIVSDNPSGQKREKLYVLFCGSQDIFHESDGHFAKE